MKRNGSTLAETLIALGIVAVASVLVIPVITDIMPDKNKVRLLQAYSDVVAATNSLLENSSIYYAPIKYENGSPVVTSNGSLARSCSGLACTDLPLISPYNSDSAKYSGSKKYPYLLMEKLNLTTSESGDTIKGENHNGKLILTATASENGYDLELTLDSNSKDCTFSASCKKPNVFEFTVLNNGNVVAMDALSRSYLESPGKTSKKKDYKLAKKMLNKPVDLDEYINNGQTENANSSSSSSESESE